MTTKKLQCGDIIDITDHACTERVLVLDIYDDTVFHGFSSSNCIMQYNLNDNIKIIDHVDLSDEMNSFHLKLNQLKK